MVPGMSLHITSLSGRALLELRREPNRYSRKLKRDIVRQFLCSAEINDARLHTQINHRMRIDQPNVLVLFFCA